jgi:hypothetical protein
MVHLALVFINKQILLIDACKQKWRNYIKKKKFATKSIEEKLFISVKEIKTDQNTKEQRNNTFFLGIQENWGPGREIGQTQKHKRE